MRIIAAFLVISASASAADLATTPDPTRDALKRSWERSLIPLVASQSLDAASSYGYRELNPALAGSNGEFGMRATAIKFAVVGAVIGGEYLLIRKSPRAARLFQKLNWTSAAVTSGLAVHNFVVR